MDRTSDLESLCKRLAGLDEVFLPIKHCEIEGEKAEEKENITTEKKFDELQKHFKQSPVKFLQRYYEHIKPNEISCFNSLPENEEVGFYIRQICHKQDLKVRTELDSHYISNEVKNRRYRAMQQMIKNGDYFSEEEMRKRNPNLYQHYIGRFLTTEEKESRLSARAAAYPTTLSGFFMDVIEKKWEKEDEENGEEEFDEDSEEEEEEEVPEISKEEKEILSEEFKSRMYESFLSGLDKNFDYRDVDMNSDYDDFHQIEQDVEDDYFDKEEPSSTTSHDQDDGQSEDELDKYMRMLDSGNNVEKT